MPEQTQEEVLFGDDDSEEESSDDENEYVGADEVSDAVNQSENPEEAEAQAEQKGQTTMNGQSVEENLAERARTTLQTLGAVSSQKGTILIEEWKQNDQVQNPWIPFAEDLSPIDQDDMQDRLEDLQENKDVWNGPIKMKVVNKGTETEPEFRFIDYEIPDSSEVPDDWEPAGDGFDGGSSSSSSSSNQDDDQAMGDLGYDEVIQTLNDQAEDGDFSFSIETSKPQFLDDGRLYVHAELVIQPDEGRSSSYTGTGTNSQGQTNSASEDPRDPGHFGIELAETRAVKRAVKNSGLLLNRGEA